MDITAELIEKIFSFSRCMKERMGGSSDIAKLSMVQLQTLVFLKKNTTASMKDIAEYLRIELPSVTDLINTLVKASLVTRKTNTKDKRMVNILLTKKGKELLEKAKEQRKKVIGKVLSPLSMQEKNVLLKILEKMVNGISLYEK